MKIWIVFCFSWRKFESNNYFNSKHNAERQPYHGNRGGYRHYGYENRRNRVWDSDSRNYHDNYANQNRGRRNYQSQNFRGGEAWLEFNEIDCNGPSKNYLKNAFHFMYVILFQ